MEKVERYAEIMKFWGFLCRCFSLAINDNERVFTGCSESRHIVEYFWTCPCCCPGRESSTVTISLPRGR